MNRRRRVRDPGEAATGAAVQATALDDARALALEMGRGVPARHFDAMREGLVLGHSETAYRRVGVWLTAQDGRCWARPSWVQVLVTDQRLLCRCNDGRLLSLPWAEVTGLQVALEQQRILVNYGDEPPIAFTGGGSAAVAVAAIVGVYGLPSLLTHPALSPMRH